MGTTNFPKQGGEPSYATNNVAFSGYAKGSSSGLPATATVSSSTNVTSNSITSSGTNFSNIKLKVTPPSGYRLCGIQSLKTSGNTSSSARPAPWDLYVSTSGSNTHHPARLYVSEDAENELVVQAVNSTGIDTSINVLKNTVYIALSSIVARYIKV